MLKNFLLSAIVLSAAASAQCSLSITGGAPGTNLVFALNGTTPNAAAWVLLGQYTGSSTLSLGLLGTLNLGLLQPYSPYVLGTTDASGDVSLSVPVPSATTVGIDLYGQGVTIGFNLPTGGPGGGIPNFGLSLCSTNVVGFHVGV